MNKLRREQLQKLSQELDIQIVNWELLNEALTHRTYTAENSSLDLKDNQRLEFLGDAVLGMIVAEHLFNEHHDKAEGDLTRMRAAVVCESALARQGLKIDLGRYLLLGKGEKMSGGATRASTISDVVEAIIGALFLDQGLLKTSDFVLGFLAEEISKATGGALIDAKTTLQELVHRLYEDGVTYEILQENGPDHDKRYEAGVKIQGTMLAQGKGRSKKEAEQQAAQKALKQLEWKGC